MLLWIIILNLFQTFLVNYYFLLNLLEHFGQKPSETFHHTDLEVRKHHFANFISFSFNPLQHPLIRSLALTSYSFINQLLHSILNSLGIYYKGNIFLFCFWFKSLLKIHLTFNIAEIRWLSLHLKDVWTWIKINQFNILLQYILLKSIIKYKEILEYIENSFTYFQLIVDTFN